VRSTDTLDEIGQTQVREAELGAHENYTALGVTLTNSFTIAIKQASATAERHRADATAAAAREADEIAIAEKGSAGSKGMIVAQRARQRAEAAHIQQQRNLVTRLAADLVPHAMLQLAAIAANPLEVGSVRVQAIDRLSDRAIGKTTTPMRVSRDDLYKMPVMDALNLLGEMASDGSMTVEEVGVHQRLLETRVKALELEQLTTRMDELESQLTGRGASQSRASTMN
jgi:hypothetical protein